MFLNSLNILCCLGLCDTDRISTSGNTDTDILFPVRGIKTIDSYDSLNTAVIDLLKCMI